MDDRDLLRAYVQGQSDQAFAELVARHVNLVYATALRLMHEPQAAQDVVQTVFIQLACKAWTVREGRALSGWLYRVTHRAAFNALQSERRRRQRETEAMNIAETESGPAAWEKLAPMLDEAMQNLNRKEQDVVMLRYFEGKSVRETGAALAVSEEAAQKRLGRAVEKMRIYFARGGVTTTAAAIATILTTRGSEATPMGFAAKVASASLAQGGGVGLAATIGNVIFMSTKTVLTMIALLGAFVLIIAGAKWVAYARNHHDGNEPASSAIARVASAPTPKPTPPIPVAPTAAAAALPAPQPAQAPAAISAQDATGTVIATPTRSPAMAEAQKDLKTAIPEAIHLLEANDFVSFAKAFMPLDDMRANLPPGTTIEQFIQSLQAQPDFPEKRSQILDALYQMQTGTPVMSPDGKTASFDYTTEKGPKRTLEFTKIDGLWYVQRLD